jgi:hypothetical protein
VENIHDRKEPLLLMSRRLIRIASIITLTIAVTANSQEAVEILHPWKP